MRKALESASDWLEGGVNNLEAYDDEKAKRLYRNFHLRRLEEVQKMPFSSVVLDASKKGIPLTMEECLQDRRMDTHLKKIAMTYASFYGHLEIVKMIHRKSEPKIQDLYYLLENFGTVNNPKLLRFILKNCRTPITPKLIEHPFENVCKFGYIECIKVMEPYVDDALAEKQLVLSTKMLKYAVIRHLLATFQIPLETQLKLLQEPITAQEVEIFANSPQIQACAPYFLNHIVDIWTRNRYIDALVQLLDARPDLVIDITPQNIEQIIQRAITIGSDKVVGICLRDHMTPSTFFRVLAIATDNGQLKIVKELQTRHRRDLRPMLPKLPDMVYDSSILEYIIDNFTIAPTVDELYPAFLAACKNGRVDTVQMLTKRVEFTAEQIHVGFLRVLAPAELIQYFLDRYDISVADVVKQLSLHRKSDDEEVAYTLIRAKQVGEAPVDALNELLVKWAEAQRSDYIIRLLNVRADLDLTPLMQHADFNFILRVYYSVKDPKVKAAMYAKSEDLRRFVVKQPKKVGNGVMRRILEY